MANSTGVAAADALQRRARAPNDCRTSPTPFGWRWRSSSCCRPSASVFSTRLGSVVDRARLVEQKLGHTTGEARDELLRVCPVGVVAEGGDGGRGDGPEQLGHAAHRVEARRYEAARRHHQVRFQLVQRAHRRDDASVRHAPAHVDVGELPALRPSWAGSRAVRKASWCVTSEYSEAATFRSARRPAGARVLAARTVRAERRVGRTMFRARRTRPTANERRGQSCLNGGA
jgi:hypothetical protein